MALDTATLISQIDKLLAIQIPPGDLPGIYAATVEVMQGTVTLARIVYGDAQESPQLHTLMKAAQHAREQHENLHISFYRHVWPAVQGTLRTMRAELEAGIVGNIERRTAGEVIADMLGLAKEALTEGSDGAKNVAAVLTAAAYEDTIRKMGATLAKVQGRPDLQDIVRVLKMMGILGGAPLSTALGYLKFRNDALHADWAKLDRAVVGSCLTFVEQLVLQHLS